MGILTFIKNLLSNDGGIVGADLTLDGLLADSELPMACDASNFVVSAIRAAQGTHFIHRRTILTDVAGVISCDASELDFLFLKPVIAANDVLPVIMPDYRAVLHAEMSSAAH